VKPHLAIQGHEKLHEKKEDEEFKTSGRDLKTKRPNFPIVQNPICGLIHTHILFSFALFLILDFSFLTPTH
jgi:hypothetical protein